MSQQLDYTEAARAFYRKTGFNNVRLIEQAMREGAKLALQTPEIAAKPQHGLGKCGTMTFRGAANAIWNKLNFALSLVGHVHSQGQMRDLMNEARELADDIVHHPQSADLSNDATFLEAYEVNVDYQKPDGYWVHSHRATIYVRVTHGVNEKQNHELAAEQARTQFHNARINSVTYQ